MGVSSGKLQGLSVPTVQCNHGKQEASTEFFIVLCCVSAVKFQ